jgi:hypothetical protein
MKNKLTDLNNHLFAQLERLGDENLTPEQIEQEIKRTDAIVSVSDQIVQNANVALRAASLVAEYGGSYETMLPMIAGKKE